MKEMMTKGFIGCVLLLSVTLPASANLLLNSDMESNTDGVVDDWIAAPGSYCTCTYDNETSYSPTHSLKLESSSTSSNGIWYQRRSVAEGTTYTLSAYMKAENRDGGGISYKIYDASWVIVGEGVMNAFGTTSDWSQYSKAITIPDNGVKIQVGLYFYHNTGTIWADNITLTAVPEPTTMILLSLGSTGLLSVRKRRA